MDGERTASDISLVLGRPGFHTLVDLRRLAAAGIVTTAIADDRVRAGPDRVHHVRIQSRPDPPTSGHAEAGPDESRAPGAPAAPLSPVSTVVAQAAEAAQASADPDVALLRRLRDALEAL